MRSGGKYVSIACWRGDIAESSRGMTQLGLLWYTVRCEATLATSGTICADVAPARSNQQTSSPKSLHVRGELTIPNYGDPLICKVICPIPARGMHHLPTKVFQPRNFGFSWEIQLSNSRREEIRTHDIGTHELMVFVPRNFNADLPLHLVVIPSGLFDLRVEADMFVQPVFFSDLSEI